MINNWKQAVLEKIAASTTRDSKEIAEAFAQQAYTAVGNRDKEIMRDPYLLGFEVIEQNEDNSRLLGAFAFRVSGEILLVPVFYLNGTIKGHQLLYRKGVNMFHPNNEKWVAHRLSKGEDEEGKTTPRSGAQQGRIHLNLSRLQGKLASDEAPESVDVKELWKEAMEAWQVTEPEHVFANLVADLDLGKQAADLVTRVPEIGDWIEMADSMAHLKSASAEEPQPTAVLYLEPPVGMGEELVEEFYKRGFAINDQRTDAEVADVIDFREPCVAVTTLPHAGVVEVSEADGSSRKVLYGPVQSLDTCYPEQVGSPDGGRVREDSILLFLEGPDEGCQIRYAGYDKHMTKPVFVQDMKIQDEEQEVGTTTPKVGEAYMLWCQNNKAFLLEYPIIVKSLKKEGDVTRINHDQSSMCAAPSIVLRDDIEDCEKCGNLLVLGTSARFVPCRVNKEYRAAGPETLSNVNYVESVSPASFTPLTADRIERVMLKAKAASIRIVQDSRGYFDLWCNKRQSCRDLTQVQLVTKLAGALHLPKSQALDLFDRVCRDKDIEFQVVAGGMNRIAKIASSIYYDRNVDPDADFSDFDFDSDLQTPMLPMAQQTIRLAMRNQRPTHQRNYLDALGTGGPRNKRIDHIPDEVILGMVNPAKELTELGETLGMGTLIDHGAVSALTKVFDAGPYIKEYVTKLEASLDYLGRLIFMLAWKPRDFSKMFGDDDLVTLENKLVGVFDSYGDLVLELLQSTGDKDSA